ncbi:hypothetical protein [Roseivirga pacifica]
MRSAVVLPEPLLPTRATFSPSAICSDKLFTAPNDSPGNFFDMFFTESTGKHKKETALKVSLPRIPTLDNTLTSKTASINSY